jgi:hypothetical protein
LKSEDVFGGKGWGYVQVLSTLQWRREQIGHLAMRWLDVRMKPCMSPEAQ